jgi:hypothetical protein
MVVPYSEQRNQSTIPFVYTCFQKLIIDCLSLFFLTVPEIRLTVYIGIGDNVLISPSSDIGADIMDQDEEYATAGPLARLFNSPEAKLLDQVRVVGNMEQTIAMLSEAANLSFKTTQRVVKKLIELDLMLPTRKLGNAQGYRFIVEGELRELVGWTDKLQKKWLTVEN